MVTRLTDRYAANRKNGESFKDFIKRIGKVELKKMLEDLARPPADPSDRSFFQRLGRSARIHAWRTWASGECAGEVVSSVEFDLAAAEREVFEAQVALESGQIEQAGQDGLSIHAARREGAGEARVVRTSRTIRRKSSREFRTRFYDTQKFFDPFAGGKFANYLFAAHEKSGEPYTQDSTRYLIDEAQLFIDAAHSCYNRISARRRQRLSHGNPQEDSNACNFSTST